MALVRKWMRYGTDEKDINFVPDVIRNSPLYANRTYTILNMWMTDDSHYIRFEFEDGIIHVWKNEGRGKWTLTHNTQPLPSTSQDRPTREELNRVIMRYANAWHELLKGPETEERHIKADDARKAVNAMLDRLYPGE